MTQRMIASRAGNTLFVTPSNLEQGRYIFGRKDGLLGSGATKVNESHYHSKVPEGIDNVVFLDESGERARMKATDPRIADQKNPGHFTYDIYVDPRKT